VASDLRSACRNHAEMQKAAGLINPRVYHSADSTRSANGTKQIPTARGCKSLPIMPLLRTAARGPTWGTSYRRDRSSWAKKRPGSTLGSRLQSSYTRPPKSAERTTTGLARRCVACVPSPTGRAEADVGNTRSDRGLNHRRQSFPPGLDWRRPAAPSWQKPGRQSFRSCFLLKPNVIAYTIHPSSRALSFAACQATAKSAWSR
jgi:hypothetical protein